MSDGSDSDASADSGSDGGYNSQEDGDSRAERELFEQKPNKRRRTNGKASAWEGIFGEDEEETSRPRGGGIGARGRSRGQASKTDWTKYVGYVAASLGGCLHYRAPQFVSTGTPKVQDGIESPSRDATQADNDDEEASDSDSSSSSAPPSPRVKENDYDEEETGASGSGIGGLGFRRAQPGTSTSQPEEEPKAPGIGARGGIGSSARGGIGSSSQDKPSPFSRGGLGSNTTTSTPSPGPDTQRERSTFTKRETAPAPVKQAALTATEAAHFRKIENNFGAKLLQKFGWSAGEGLGKDKSGRAVPIEAGKVLRGRGITSGIRTEDSKREARRKGEIVSDDEEENQSKGKSGRKAGPSKSKKEPQEQSWRSQKKVKVKVEHKTYEQLLAESGGAPSGVGLVLDARGGEVCLLNLVREWYTDI